MFPMCCGYRVLAATTLVLGMFCVVGCGSGGRASVQGTVSYNGAAVDNGTISFVPSDGGTAGGAGGEIADGKYSISAERGPLPGKYRVEIYWNKKTGKMVGTPGDMAVKMPETKQVLPPKFNRQTELTADITSGNNTKNFDLK